jgi:ubiquitin-conjugating enzyme E2 A
MSFVINRLTKELDKLKKEPVEGFTLEEFSNIMIWQGTLEGPKDTPYENGKFKIQFTFDTDYPIKPPSVKFLQYIYHPNLYKDGKICVDILQSHEWSPAQNVRTIIHSLRSLFMDPNPSSPANREAAELYMKDKVAYVNKVKEFINKIN